MTAQHLRENPAGFYSFKVGADYTTVYEKALAHARSCYEDSKTTNNFVVHGDSFPESKKSTIIIVRQRALSQETLFTMDFVQTGLSSTDVNVYYAMHRYKNAALTMEEWITKDSKECNIASVVVECACYAAGP